MGLPFKVLVYFAYGLAFFSMGLLVSLEGGRSSDLRLRRALRPLAGFGIIHAIHVTCTPIDRRVKQVIDSRIEI